MDELACLIAALPRRSTARLTTVGRVTGALLVSSTATPPAEKTPALWPLPPLPSLTRPPSPPPRARASHVMERSTTVYK